VLEAGSGKLKPKGYGAPLTLMAAWAEHCVPPAGGAADQQNSELPLTPQEAR
jgi:hypothetical protein